MLTAILAFQSVDRAAGDDAVQIQVPDGFEATLYADDDLAHDIYSMTIDSLGRVVVSGAGYVRILIDDDGDGRADRFQQFADGPQTGAQGMHFRGRDLLCVGDGGLLRYRDQNADDRADADPDLFLELKTGSEHHAHAIRQGPDGWWYLIAGNYAEITEKYITRPTSPVLKPDAGTLLRFTPDLSGGEIVADGFRNAYDFDFHPLGDIFTFDSDGERDISLPFYRPTRVFHVLPGSNAGWKSRSWKRPDEFADMPPVVASFGRGSPTGVVCYRHTQFPQPYRGALFVLDWTFGRVLAVPLKLDGSTWSSEPKSFATGKGQFGFAPTDAEVGPDGSLYVSVGGRGTRGGVFRIRHTGEESAPPASDDETEDPLVACLTAPQPLASWSRNLWMPRTAQLGKAPFVAAALDSGREPAQRVRAIEIVTEMFRGFDEAALSALAADASPGVRARAAWSLGRAESKVSHNVWNRFLSDDDPLVLRFALQALPGALSGESPALPATSRSAIVAALAGQLAAEDRFNRQAAVRAMSRLDPDTFSQVAAAGVKLGWQAGLSVAFAYVNRHAGFSEYAFQVALPVLEGDFSTEMKLDAVRLMQLGLGDVGPGHERPAVFDGYTAHLDTEAHERALNPIRTRLADLYPTGTAALDNELARLIAMLTPYNGNLLTKVLDHLTDDSHPVDDLHHLIVAGCFPVERTQAQNEAIAGALVRIEDKLQKLDLKQDTNWNDRVSECYASLAQLDPDLPPTLLQQPGFGRPGHVMFLSQMPPEHLQTAIDRFAAWMDAHPDTPPANDVVFVLGESTRPEHRQKVRALFDDFSVRNAVLMTLAEAPQPEDRQRLLAGLESAQVEVLAACLDGLAKLPKTDAAREQLLLLKTARRLKTDKREYALREQAMQLLRRNTAQDFGFQFTEVGYAPQSDVLDRWTEWLTATYPTEATEVLGGSAPGLEKLPELLASVDWNGGDATRGELLFRQRSCAQCHGGGRALGPDLAGAARRFSQRDLFTAIYAPSRDVSPRYQTVLIETVDGKVYSGLIIYESVDGMILRNGTNQTFRIESDEIESRRTLNASLMPEGLLKDLQPSDLADLYAYLRSLGEQTAMKK